MKEINRTWFFIITVLIAIFIPAFCDYYFDIIPILDSDYTFSIIVKITLVLISAALLELIIYAVFSCITISELETTGVVLKKWWKKKTGTRYITINKVMIPQTYTYDEYSVKVKSPFGTNTITTDVTTYAKVEINNHITVIETKSILGEYSYDLAID